MARQKVVDAFDAVVGFAREIIERPDDCRRVMLQEEELVVDAHRELDGGTAGDTGTFFAEDEFFGKPADEGVDFFGKLGPLLDG